MAEDKLQKTEDIIKIFADENLAVVDIKAIEKEILKRSGAINANSRFPRSDDWNKRELLMEFLRITKPYIKTIAEDYPETIIEKINLTGEAIQVLN